MRVGVCTVSWYPPGHGVSVAWVPGWNVIPIYYQHGGITVFAGAQWKLRYTFDNWRTYVDTDAVYQGPCNSSNNSRDRFSFSFACHHKEGENQQLQLALRYLVNGQEFWDNNNGQNYSASLTNKTDPIMITSLI
ncbi:hypothetical protein K492DRAFT_239419 [Lichtheimia hyalospora FSU 10163]|nr:hypothetical protein K492DRAFT_239419 [Lichtheimia hyalospora FSU 10163]